MLETVPDIDDSNIRAAFDREKLRACHIGDATSHVSASLFNPFFFFLLDSLNFLSEINTLLNFLGLLSFYYSGVMDHLLMPIIIFCRFPFWCEGFFFFEGRVRNYIQGSVI